jgi:hypothetical protein
MGVISVILTSDDFDPLPFIFTDKKEATEFLNHVTIYYKEFRPIYLSLGIDTYDSAIQSLVEAVGPSKD